MLSLCTSTTVFVLSIHHSGDFKTRVPKWLKVLILDRLASLLMLKHKVELLGTEADKVCYPSQQENCQIHNFHNSTCFSLQKSTVESPKMKCYTGSEEDINTELHTESLINICQVRCFEKSLNLRQIFISAAR